MDTEVTLDVEFLAPGFGTTTQRQTLRIGTMIAKDLLKSSLVERVTSLLALNSSGGKGPALLGVEDQYALAVQALSERRILFLIDGEEVLDLDQTVRVHPEIQVTFLRLIPLVGG